MIYNRVERRFGGLDIAEDAMKAQLSDTALAVIQNKKAPLLHWGLILLLYFTLMWFGTVK